MKFTTCAMLAASGVVLAACGGGGGSPIDQASIDAKYAARDSYLAEDYSYTEPQNIPAGSYNYRGASVIATGVDIEGVYGTEGLYFGNADIDVNYSSGAMSGTFGDFVGYSANDEQAVQLSGSLTMRSDGADPNSTTLWGLLSGRLTYDGQTRVQVSNLDTYGDAVGDSGQSFDIETDDAAVTTNGVPVYFYALGDR